MGVRGIKFGPAITLKKVATEKEEECFEIVYCLDKISFFAGYEL